MLGVVEMREEHWDESFQVDQGRKVARQTRKHKPQPVVSQQEPMEYVALHEYDVLAHKSVWYLDTKQKFSSLSSRLSFDSF